jgi:hypothetical protein
LRRRSAWVLEDAGTQVKFVLHDRDASFTARSTRFPGRLHAGHPLRGAGVADEFGPLDLAEAGIV